jgi:hypothetical protein
MAGNERIMIPFPAKEPGYIRTAQSAGSDAKKYLMRFRLRAWKLLNPKIT